MERVSEVELLRRQVADRGLVVWYDPLKAYGGLAARLAIARLRRPPVLGDRSTMWVRPGAVAAVGHPVWFALRVLMRVAPALV